MRKRFFLQNFLFFTLPVIAVVLAAGIIASCFTISKTRKSVLAVNKQTAEQMKEGTTLILNEADAQSLNYNISPYVMLQLETLLKNGYQDKNDLNISYMIKPFLDSNVNSKPFLHSIYIYLDNENDNFFSSSIGLANQQNYKDTEWLEQSRAKPKDITQWLEVRTVSTYAMSSYSTEVLSIYKRWYRPGKDTAFGLVVINTNLDYLNNFYRNYLVYPEQAVLLVNADGKVLSGAGNPKIDINIFYYEQILDEYYVSEQSDHEFGLTYYSLIPKSIVFREIMKVLTMILTAIAIALFLGGILSYILTRRYVKIFSSILTLLDSAERGIALPEIRKSNDLYGYIIQNIVKTFLDRNSLDKQLMEKKYLLEKMHFSFLQAQLNPHFLFNTLKNIFWMTVSLTGKPNDASIMIDLLTSLLSYTLEPERMVAVTKELEHTKRYIQIQQMRFKNRFEVEWDLEGDLDQLSCIKFLLQPLIENSITYGLSARINGKLHICVQDRSGTLFFSVTDNGAGFTPERLEEIKKHLADEHGSEDGIGLYNLNKRLVIAYGISAALRIKSTPGMETCISFVVPAE